MSWFKVDDRFPTHRKVLSLRRGAGRLQAIGAWTLAGAWSAGTDTEGHIPADVLGDLGVPLKTANDLVNSGLWQLCKIHHTCYQMHDYLDYNPTAEKVQADKAAAAERQRRAREKAARLRIAAQNGRVLGTPSRNATVTALVTAFVTRDVTHSSRRESRAPRPVPSRRDGRVASLPSSSQPLTGPDDLGSEVHVPHASDAA